MSFDPTFNPLDVLGEQMYFDKVLGGTTTTLTENLNDKTTTINKQIVNLSDSTSTKACPSQPITSGYTTTTNSITFSDPVNGSVTITCSDDVNSFQNFLLLNPSMRPTTNNDTNYAEPGGFGSSNPFAANGWYHGDIPELGYSGRTSQFFTPCTGLTPSTYDASLQTDVSNGVYGCHFTWDFGTAVKWTSVKFYTNSGLVIFPVFTPRWVFFFGSNDGTTWTQFTPPQNHDYPFPGTSYYQVAVNNLEYTYTFDSYNTAYRYYRIAVGSAGTGYFYLSSVQWIANGQFSASQVATASLTNVSVGTSNKQLNLQFDDLRFNNVPFGQIVTDNTNFGTTAQSSVAVGVNTQVLNLTGSTVNVNGVEYQNQPIIGALSDETSTLTVANQLNIRCPFGISIKSSALPYWWVNTLPTATTPITFDIHKNGTSIYSTKPTLSSVATNNASQNGVLIADPTTFAKGDLLTAKVHVVGSGTPSGAKVHIYNT